MSSLREFESADTETVEDALALLNAALDTPISMPSHIDGEEYTLIGIGDDFDTGLEAGAAFETSETFCHCVYNDQTGAEVIPNIGEDARVAGLPAHANLGLQSYVGVPLYRDGTFYGTVIACDTSPRDFADDDVQHAKPVAI